MKKYDPIMKEKLRGQLGMVSTTQTEWVEYVLDCVAVGICPSCGNDLNPHQETSYKDLGEPNFYLCLKCGWNDYI